jgi:hypothetical protein
MPVTATLADQLRRLSAREKAAVADHLWREAETKLGPTKAQVAELDHRAAAALAAPQKLRPSGDALRRLRR